MVIDLPLLLDEIERAHIDPAQLHIDPAAVLLDASDRITEGSLRESIGSTLSGTGAATARKIMRPQGLRLAAHAPELAHYLADVSAMLNDDIDAGKSVIVEGTQGFGLSLHHSGVYPFTTSRDTSAAAFLSEAGLSPRLVTDIFLVLRTYPIRVAGNSGPLANEIDWPTVTRLSRYPTQLSEFTTVTQRLRRVGRFDFALAQRAVRVNRPTGIALHGLDYIDYADFGKTSFKSLTFASQAFIANLEGALGVPVLFAFTGPAAEHIIDRR
jgi:adenylosuccinate synthase